MLLTVSKRLEFSASRRLFVQSWSDAENLVAFGPETAARYGTGRNYVAYFIFSGAVDQGNGMLLNISEIKSRVGQVLHHGFDHKFLNEDNALFADLPPTVENIVHQLFLSAQPLFKESDARLVACHLAESEQRSATFFENGVSETNYWFEFSAARQTTSPQLTTQENEQLFGVAASPLGHGHNYRVRLTFRTEQPLGATPLVQEQDIQSLLSALHTELDHKNLNREVSGLFDRPITTENLARYLHEEVSATLPVLRVRVHERDDFFAEYHDDEAFFLGIQRPLSAAHRLQSARLSHAENLALYGRCNNPRGHGHLYLTEATIGGKYDERSGTLYNFAALREAAEDSLRPWQDKHLDLETEEFRETPSTGENIVQALWPRIDSRLNNQLVRLRLWETANNRFTLRRGDTPVARGVQTGDKSVASPAP